MKRLYFKAIGLLLLLLPLCVARGQSVVTEVQQTKSDTTIVRHWTEEINIVYTHNKENENYFLLVNIASPQVLRIAVPSHVTVNDFRIQHDSVFLCGHLVLGASQHGLLACFAIQDFYNGSGVFLYGIPLQTAMPDCVLDPAFGVCNCRNMIYDITRMAVYDSSGFTKVAYVAKNYVGDLTDSRVGIGYAYCHGGNWSSWIIYNKHAKEEYTDIIATQNYVVAVGRTNDSARLVMRIFPKGDFLVPSWDPYLGYIYAWPYYADRYGQRMSDLEVDKNVMATALDGDAFAVAYHYSNLSGDGLALKTFYITSGQATLTQGLTAPIVRQPGSVWKMRDLCYSSPQKKLSLLNDSDGGTVGSQASIIYHFQLPLSSSGTYYGRYQPLYTLSSLDSFGSFSDAFISSGNRPSGCLSLYWEKPWYTPTCFIEDSIPGYSGSASLYTTYMVTNINEPYPVFGTEPFSVEILDKLPVCEQ